MMQMWRLTAHGTVRSAHLVVVDMGKLVALDVRGAVFFQAGVSRAHLEGRIERGLASLDVRACRTTDSISRRAKGGRTLRACRTEPTRLWHSAMSRESCPHTCTHMGA